MLILHKCYEYLLMDVDGLNKRVVKGDKLHASIDRATYVIEKVNSYEIYTSCPVTGQGGYDIKLVKSTNDRIKSYPNFDCVITVNDCHPKESWFE